MGWIIFLITGISLFSIVAYRGAMYDPSLKNKKKGNSLLKMNGGDVKTNKVHNPYSF